MNGFLRVALKQSDYGKIFRTRHQRRRKMAIPYG